MHACICHSIEQFLLNSFQSFSLKIWCVILMFCFGLWVIFNYDLQHSTITPDGTWEKICTKWNYAPIPQYNLLSSHILFFLMNPLIPYFDSNFTEKKAEHETAYLSHRGICQNQSSTPFRFSVSDMTPTTSERVMNYNPQTLVGWITLSSLGAVDVSLKPVWNPFWVTFGRMEGEDMKSNRKSEED